MEIFETIDQIITNLLGVLGSAGAILGCVFILFESIIPILPLSVFITLNFMAFGNILGFVISWVFTVLGCILSYWLFKNGVSERLYDKFKSSPNLTKIMDAVSNLSFTNLVILIAIPFTPAFLINIAAGICRVNSKKFIYAIMIGKISLVYFWGFVGVSLIESLKNPMILIKVAIAVLVMYVISLIFSKKVNIK